MLDPVSVIRAVRLIEIRNDSGREVTLENLEQDSPRALVHLLPSDFIVFVKPVTVLVRYADDGAPAVLSTDEHKVVVIVR